MPVVSIIFCRCCQRTFKPVKGEHGRTLCKRCRPQFKGLVGQKLRQAITSHRFPQNFAAEIKS